MKGRKSVSVGIFLLLFVSIPAVISADSVISTKRVDLFDAGRFSDENEWTITSTSGFSDNIAEFTRGIIADNELSFTHDRPDNFEEITIWASSSSTGSSSVLDEPDEIYSSSTGPDISAGGFQVTNLENLEIENISLVLHFSIPDELHTDEVNILLQNHGSDRLLVTYYGTLSGINRMINPLNIPLDDVIEWDWEKISQTLITIDYVADGGLDDTEVRVDAVGIKVKYHQPWFSFENIKAEHMGTINNSPVIDFDPYDGTTSRLIFDSCGLKQENTANTGFWEIEVIKPAEQSFGRIHLMGVGNFSVSIFSEINEGEYIQINDGDLIDSNSDMIRIKVEIYSGCISGIRIDINDPRLIITGSISGELDGLYRDSSYLRFAVGDQLIYQNPMTKGDILIDIPIGEYLPESGEVFEFGIASRFQWASNGTAERTVVHIDSIKISGGYEIDWDYDPTCLIFDNIYLEEDEGSRLISIDSMCEDDFTDESSLTVLGVSQNTNIVTVEGEGTNMIINPVINSYGTSDIDVKVFDESQNYWEGEFKVIINSTNDPPKIIGLPNDAYVELGDEIIIDLEIYDIDSDIVAVTSSKSWAIFDGEGTIIVSPVEVGNHELIITATDGEVEISEKINIFVYSNADLLIESLDIRNGGVTASELVIGDVIELVVFVRNQGLERATNISIQCSMGGIIIQTKVIQSLEPGELETVICDVQLVSYGNIEFEFNVDAVNSIIELNEDNNNYTHNTLILDIVNDGKSSNLEVGIIIISIIIIFTSLLIIQFGPWKIKKEFEKTGK